MEKILQKEVPLWIRMVIFVIFVFLFLLWFSGYQDGENRLIQFNRTGGHKLKSRIYRDSIDDILREWDIDGEGDFQEYLIQMFQIKWNEYVISNQDRQ